MKTKFNDGLKWEMDDCTLYIIHNCMWKCASHNVKHVAENAVGVAVYTVSVAGVGECVRVEGGGEWGGGGGD